MALARRTLSSGSAALEHAKLREALEAVKQRMRSLEAAHPELPRCLHTQDELEGAMQRHVSILESVIHSAIMRQTQGSTEAVANAAVAQVAAQVRQEVPLAAEQVLRESDSDRSGDITEAEWHAAWRAHPELLDVMSVAGMSRAVKWAEALGKRREE